MRRYLETLFRFRKLFLVPVLAVPIVAMLTTLYIGRVYNVKASIWVAPSPYLSQETSGKLGPNEIEAQLLREWLATDSFSKEVMDRVGLTAAIKQKQWPVPTRLQNQLEATGLADVPGLHSILGLMNLTKPSTLEESTLAGLKMMRSSLRVSTQGTDLLLVSYSGKEPLLGTRLVEETLTLFNDRTIAQRQEEARAAIDFYTQQLKIQGDRLSDAGAALQLFQETHPAPRGQSRPPAEQRQYDLLDRNQAVEQTLYETTLTRLEDVRMAGEAAVSGQAQKHQLVDAPTAPAFSGFTKRFLMTTIMLGIILGVVLGIVPIIVLTWTDNRVHSRDDIQQILKPLLIVEVPVVPQPPGAPPSSLVRQALTHTTDHR